VVARASILVLVSHSMETVRQMCGRAIWLNEGRIRLDGTAAEVTAAYERGG
jgi:ABC-type polysaccharide/polyol phosphate transport system ATPase subunit